MKQIYKYFFIGLLAALNGAFAAPFVSVDREVQAGSTASLVIDGVKAFEEVAVQIRHEGGKVERQNMVADMYGVVRSEIYETALYDAGSYEIFIKSGSFERVSYLMVLPAGPSVAHSKINVLANQPAFDSGQRVPVEVVIYDAYKNIVPNQEVLLLSSDADDVVTASVVTNAAGVARFEVDVEGTGVRTLSAVVANRVLLDRAEVVVGVPDFEPKNVGNSEAGIGQFLQAQLFDEVNGEVAYFSIEEIPSRVLVDENQTFKVVAKDEEGQTVRDYFGTVRFSSSDDRIQLPADYTFNQENQGEHRFSIAVTFGTLGTQTLVAHDLDDFRISGERTVDVVRDLNGSIPTTGDSAIELTSPTPGNYKSARMTITGLVSGLQQVKIIDGANVLISDLEVSDDGTFVYQTPALANGLHKFQALSIDEVVVSNEISVVIDRVPPTVLAVEVAPQNLLETGQEYSISLSATEPLSRARCVVDEVSLELREAGDRFVVSSQAPIACGEYPVSCTVADLLGNELVEPNAALIEVCGNEEPVIEPVVEPLPQPGNVAPSGVFNLNATPGDKRVTLYWSPANDDKGIKQYKVEYGLFPNELTGLNMTPDNRTQWYVADLEEATKYFFRVTAIDTDGVKGVASGVVEATTLGESEKPAAPKLDDSGPGEINQNYLFPLILALLGGGVFFFSLKFNQ